MKRTLSLFIYCSIIFCFCKSDTPSYNEVIQSKNEMVESSSQSAVSKDTIEIKKDTVALGNQKIDSARVEKVSIEMALEQNEKEPEQKALTKPKLEKKGKMSFEQSVFDFGTIDEGEVVNFDFHFTNTGNAPINIKSCTATCGCTTPSYPFLPIAPGEKGFIGVTYNSVGKFGTQTPVVTVVSDGATRVVKLKLTGIVNPKLEEKNTVASDSSQSSSY